MSQRISFTVTGKVQGVNYRSWTVSKANSLNITGYAKNADDGTVVGEAQGDASNIDKFKQMLAIGPNAAQVSSVDQRSIDIREGDQGFQRL